VISHPPYSPDFTPDDFFWSLKWKTPSEEEGFRLLRISGKNSATELNASLDAFIDRFAQVLEECKKFVELKRD
jgi:hypothetical protein